MHSTKHASEGIWGMKEDEPKIKIKPQWRRTRKKNSCSHGGMWEWPHRRNVGVGNNSTARFSWDGGRFVGRWCLWTLLFVSICQLHGTFSNKIKSRVRTLRLFHLLIYWHAQKTKNVIYLLFFWYLGWGCLDLTKFMPYKHTFKGVLGVFFKM